MCQSFICKSKMKIRSALVFEILKIFGSCSSDCFDISDPSCSCVSVQSKFRGILISVSIDFYVLQLCPDQDGVELLQLDARSDQRVNPGGHFPVGFRHHPAREG